MVDDNDVRLFPVDFLTAPDDRMPCGRDAEEYSGEESREFVHASAGLVERVADYEGQSRQYHEHRAADDDEDIEY